MKILLVNYYYKPMVDAHAYRWTQLSEYWIKKGFKVDVICSKVRGSDNFEKSGGVNIARVGLRMANKIQSEFYGSKSKKNFVSNGLSIIKKKLRLMYRFVYWPDGLWHWFFAAAFELFKRRREKYDVVVSYAPSFSAHLAVLFYKKTSRENFHWIADYGDPFSTSSSMPHNNSFIYSGLDHFIEGLVLRVADKVFFTNKKTLQEYVDKFGGYKYCVNPHLVDVEKFYCDSDVDCVGGLKIIRFVYIGNFHFGIREPFLAAKIFNVLSEKMFNEIGCQIVFDIYGSSNGLELSGLANSVINWHGPIARDDVHNVIKGAHFLVNIENSNCSMTPSKIVECVATGKPIINIANCESELSELLIDYEVLGGSINLVGFSGEVTYRLIGFLENYKLGRVIPYKEVSEFLRDYRMESVANRYLR